MSDDLKAASAYYDEGIAARENGELGRAQAAFVNAAAHFAAANEPRGEANALTNLGAVCADARQYGQAIEALERAVRMHEANGNPEGAAVSAYSLATTVFDAGQRFRARALLEDAARRLRVIGATALLESAEAASAWLETALPAGLTADEEAHYDAWSAELKTASELGMLGYRLGNFAQAVQHWQRALTAAQELRRHVEVSELLGYIATALCHQGRFDAGIETFTHAVSFAAEVGARAFQAAALNGLACAYLDLGRLPEAITLLQQAVDVSTDSSPPANRAEILGNLGMAYARNGNADAAISALGSALDLYRAVGNHTAAEVIEERIPAIRRGATFTEGFVFTNPATTVSTPADFDQQIAIARAHESRGEYAEALAVYRRLLDTARSLEDDRLQAFVYIAIGFAARRAGDTTQALASYHQALSAARRGGDAEWEARALNNLGVLYAVSDHDTAAKFLEAAADIRRGLTDQQELGETYLSWAQVASCAAAPPLLQKALALLNPERNPYAWATAYIALKARTDVDATVLAQYRETAQRLGADDFANFVDAGGNVEQLHEMIPLREEGGVGLIVRAPKGAQRPRDFDWQVQVTRAESLWITGDHTLAINVMFAAIAAIEQERVGIADPHERNVYLARQWAVYDTQVAYLIAERRFAEALEVIERIKGRTIIDVIGENDEVPPTVDPALRDAYRRVRRDLRRASEDLAELQKSAWAGESPSLAAARGNAARGYAQMNVLVEQIAKVEPAFYPSAPAGGVAFAQMHELLQSAVHAFLVYWFGDKAAGAFVLSQAGVQFVPLPVVDGAAAPVESFAATLDKLPLSRYDFEERLTALYWQLVGPVAPALEAGGIRELTIVPHHHAHLVPFHALPADGVYLGERYRLDYAPSFALYALCRGRASDGTTALIVADPDGSLPFARREAEAVHAMLGKSTLLVGADAHVDNTDAPLRAASIVHFACHGTFGADQGRDIALRLASTVNHSGAMSLRQVMSHVSVSRGALVVLSACRTGRTVLSRSDEYIGLPGGFIVAGAGAVIGSLWAVEDVSTCLLMEQFYRRLAYGRAHADALADAQRWLRTLPAARVDDLTRDLPPIGGTRAERGDESAEPFAHPYYWAGFFAIGHWVAPHAADLRLRVTADT